MPFFCPVPTDAPLVPGGAVIQRQDGSSMIPSAGPYYVADAFNGEYAILKRNPNYVGPRPHALDAIALREGVDPGQAVARVQSGTWDGITNLGDPIMSLDGQVAKTWGPSGTGKNGPRYYSVPGGGLTYLDLNAGRPLFADRSIRQAVAYALDRRALARIFGNSIPTDQLLPPNQPGSQDAGFFPLDGPDLEKARALMRGRKGTAVLVTGTFNDPGPAEAIKDQLAEIGIHVRIKAVDNSFDAIHNPGAPYDLKIGGNSLDPLSTTVYLQSMLGAVPESRKLLLPAVLPADWKSRAMRALAVKLRNVTSETAALQLVNGPIQAEVPMTGLAYSVEGALLAPGVGCRIFPPASFGVDFAALCLTGASS
jgi:ABC-type transport system substrate-binding protein